jgi:hypothetical protein
MGGGWNLCYFLPDDSAFEQKDFHEAFKGMPHGISPDLLSSNPDWVD